MSLRRRPKGGQFSISPRSSSSTSMRAKASTLSAKSLATTPHFSESVMMFGISSLVAIAARESDEEGRHALNWVSLTRPD